MSLVYSRPKSMILGSMSSALNEEGIETEIRNDILGVCHHRCRVNP
jgi:hypothetical protein